MQHLTNNESIGVLRSWGKQNPMTFPGFPGPRFIYSHDIFAQESNLKNTIFCTEALTHFAVVDNLFPKIEERIWIEITS